MIVSSEHKNELFAALSKAQSQMQNAKKDSDNPFFRSKYADLASVWEVAKGPLTDNGLCISGVVENDEFVIILGHSSGQMLVSRMVLKPVKPDPQGIGACMTYYRRFLLSAICGLATEDDDDGNTASGNPAIVNQKTQPKKAVEKPAPVNIPENPESSKTAVSDSPTGAEVRELMESAKPKGWQPSDVKEVLGIAFGLSTSANLTRVQFTALKKMVTEFTPLETFNRFIEENKKRIEQEKAVTK